MTRPRDSQRQRLYAAELAAAARVPAPTLDGTPAAAQAFVDRVTRSAWWGRQAHPTWKGDRDIGWPFRSGVPARILVSPGRSTMAGAWASDWVERRRGRWYPVIRLGTAARRDRPAAIADPWVILHEIAHHGIPEVAAAHGRQFARLYLGLVRRFLGPDHAGALRDEYIRHRVRYRQPPALTGEQRTERAARLAAHRPSTGSGRTFHSRTMAVG